MSGHWGNWGRRIWQGRFFYGWVIVGAGVSSSLTEVAMLNPILSVMMKPMAEEFGWSRSAISGAGTVGTLVGATVAPLVGRALDRWGARVVLTIGSTVIGVCLLGLGIINAYLEYFIIYGAGRMAASGATLLATSVAVSNWFIRQRGRAVGILLFGTRLGQTVLPLLAQYVIVIVNWRAAWATMGAFVLAFSVLPSALFMRRRPEDLGLHPDGLELEKPAERSGHEAIPASSEARSPEEPVWSLGEASRTGVFWLLALAEAQAFFVSAGIFQHLVPYLTDRGFATGVAVGALSLAGLTSGLGGVALGFVAERFPVRYALASVLGVAGLTMSVLIFVSSVEVAFLFAALYGLVFGGSRTLMIVVWAEYFGRLSLGTIRGLANVFQTVGNATGPLFASFLFDLFGNYLLAFTIYAVCYLGAGLWVLVAQPPKKRLVEALA